MDKVREVVEALSVSSNFTGHTIDESQIGKEKLMILVLVQ